MGRQKILIIEDDPVITELIVALLEEAGFQLLSARNGRDGFKAALRHLPDLILLDVVMPGTSGTDVCRAIKRSRKLLGVPVIFLTACHEEADRVAGLERGADDYIVKPFSSRELVLRIQAVLRRSATTTLPHADALTVGPLSVRADSLKVTLQGVPLHLTAIEFKLLLSLVQNTGVLLSRAQLMEAVRGNGYSSELRTIDTHVNRLRSKLGASGDMIKTVRGFGYLLEATTH